jgi:hypothetical protein
MSIARLCSVEGCDKSLMCRELCNMHYKRQTLHGDIGSPYPLHRSVRHGESKTKLYFVWTSIKQRTSNPNSQVWEFYGDRGIKMHPEWRDSFLAFKRDVIDGYGPGMSIDRIDDDGNYEPGNVRWVRQLEQTLNQRLTQSNRSLDIEGSPSTAKGQCGAHAYSQAGIRST